MQSTGPKAAQPKFGSATVFLLFPGWCAQCVREAKQIVPALVRTAVLKGPGDDSDVHIYALLADEMPAPKSVTSGVVTRSRLASKVAPSEPEKDKAPTPEDELHKTPTLVVAPSTLAQFYATDFPFLIATDYEGRIRLMVSAAPSNALDQGGPIDQLTGAILSRWPPPQKGKEIHHEAKQE